MPGLWTILGTVLGIGIGSIFTYLILRAKIQNASEKGKAEVLNEISIINERLENRSAQIEELKAALRLKDEEIRTLSEKNIASRENIAELETRLAEERKQTEDKLKLLEESKEKLAMEFKNLANEIFDDKTKKFSEHNKAGLEALLKPLGEKIRDFEKKVEDTHEKGIKESASLREIINNLQKANQRISEDAENLANALKGQVKTQGNWGELVLEKVLEASGLNKGLEYNIQESFTAEDGTRLQPDVIINLPENRHIIIDSKVSLTAYERYCSSSDEKERIRALKEHITSMKNHIKELGEKHYQDLNRLKSLDFIFMFIPVESAYNLAIQLEANVFFEANKSKIVIVTPSTLLAALKLIAYLWQQEAQNKNAAEIARQSGNMYDKFVNFVEDLTTLGSRLEQAQKSYDTAINKLQTGRGNLITTSEKIKKLGARTNKQLPEKLIEETADVIEADRD